MMTSFVIEYDRVSGNLCVTPFSDPREASAERFRRNQNRASKNVEVVSVTTDSLESLKRSHSRYFLRKPEFV